MPTRPTTPDPTGQPAGPGPFGGLGAGLDFFQDWLKAAGSALPNLQTPSAAGGHMGSWALPTLDPEELDKRIQDLKTVQFWLEQNARMIAMTIQGLEVQKATLSTLQGMNVSMDALRDALQARAPQTAAAAATAPTEQRDVPPDAPQPGPELINPMRWWDTLTQQFTHLASQTAQSAQSVGAGAGTSSEASPGTTRRKPPRANAGKADRGSPARPTTRPARKT